jgi:hypothetical protein
MLCVLNPSSPKGGTHPERMENRDEIAHRNPGRYRTSAQQQLEAEIKRASSQSKDRSSSNSTPNRKCNLPAITMACLHQIKLNLNKPKE